MKKTFRMAALLTAAAALLFSLCACNEEEKTPAPKETYTELLTFDDDYAAADAYLLENGYPEAFISETGNQTKLLLQKAGAVYERDSRGDMQYGERERPYWEGFSSSVTVSDASLPDKDISVKYITCNWYWNGGRPLGDDALELNFGGDHAVLLRQCALELHGEGKLIGKGDEDKVQIKIPQTDNVTFRFQQQWETSDDLELRFTLDGARVGLSLDSNGYCRKWFKDAAGSSTMAYGDYAVDVCNLRGSFTLALIRYIGEPVTGTAAFTYIRSVEADDDVPTGYLKSNVRACNFGDTL